MEGNGKASIAEAEELAGRPDVDVVPTAPEEPNLLPSRRARILRRLFMTVLIAFLILGLTGWLGVRSRTTTVQGGGYELSVTHGQTSRGGLATPWSVQIRHPGGFEGPITVSTDAKYLDLFDENGFDPDPSKATTAGELFVWEFDPPLGDTLVVRFDARVEPARQGGARAVTSVLEDDRPVVSVSYETRLMP